MLAWSGGKDSTLALEAMRADPDTHVLGGITAVTPGYDRVSMHGIRRPILRAQSESLDLPIIEAELPIGGSNETYEAAWARALARAASTLGAFTHVAYGDLFLEDVRAYRDAQLARLGLEPLYPIWGQPTDSLAHHFIAQGYEAWLTCVDTTQLDASFAGRRFDASLLADFPASVDPCGERGEFHTFCWAGPMFARDVPVVLGERVTRDGVAFADLLPA